MIAKVQITRVVELKYNPKSKEFQRALKSYNRNIQSGGESDLIEHIALQVAEYGTTLTIDGVGYVKDGQGKCTDEDNYCGVQVTQKEYPEAEII